MAIELDIGHWTGERGKWKGALLHGHELVFDKPTFCPGQVSFHLFSSLFCPPVEWCLIGFATWFYFLVGQL